MPIFLEKNQKEDRMGGRNETRVDGLRCHESDGMVHVHDDSKSMKFQQKIDEFKESIKEAFDQLDKKEGIYKIIGKTSTQLCICRDGKTYEAFLLGGKSAKKDLKSFVGGL